MTYPLRPLLAIAVTEASQLGRMALLPSASLAGLFAGVAFIQEPPGLAAIGLAFAWESVQAALVCLAAMLPLIWLLFRARGRLEWERRVTPSPAWDAVARSCGIALAGVLVLGGAVATCIAVERIVGKGPSLLTAVGVWTNSVLALLPLAALAPCVAARFTSVPASVLGWSLLLVASAGALGRGLPVPLDRVLESGGQPDAGVLVAVALSTGAGLMLSSCTARRRFPTGGDHSSAAVRASKW